MAPPEGPILAGRVGSRSVPSRQRCSVVRCPAEGKPAVRYCSSLSFAGSADWGAISVFQKGKCEWQLVL
jgi:hypothetical protein